MDKKNNLQCNLRVIFAQKNIKARQVAADLETSETVVSNWVSGRSHPTTEKLFKLAYLLDCKVDDIYTYTPN